MKKCQEDNFTLFKTDFLPKQYKENTNTAGK